MRKFLQKISHPFLKRLGEYYFSKPRKYTYEGIEVIVYPEVFPPHYTLSTKILLDFLKEQELRDKTLLELGCGSGIISLFASSKKAIVTASDINLKALEYLEQASNKNKLEVEIIDSDLFENISNSSFDYVIINPPYYPKEPKNIQEKAWFCGENFEYFKSLFHQLSLRNDKVILMILSEDCDLESIKSIAKENHLSIKEEFKKKIWHEINYVFRILNENN